MAVELTNASATELSEVAAAHAEITSKLTAEATTLDVQLTSSKSELAELTQVTAQEIARLTAELDASRAEGAVALVAAECAARELQTSKDALEAQHAAMADEVALYESILKVNVFPHISYHISMILSYD